MTIIDNVLKEISSGDIVDNRVIIPEGVKVIDREVFFENSVIKEVVFPSTLEEMKESAFKECVLLDNVILPKNLKKIGESAFSACLNLKNLVLNDDLEEIGSNAFKYNVFINKIAIPKSIKTLGKDCFETLNFAYYDKGKLYFSSNEEKINNNQMIFPVNFIEELSNVENIHDFFKYSDFKAFNSNFNNFFDFWKEKYKNNYAEDSFFKEEVNMTKLLGGEKVIEKNYYNYKDEMLSFFKFAYLIGCFNNNKYKNLDCKISNKSSSLLYRLTKQNNMSIGNYHNLLKDLSINIKVSDGFIKFISHNNNNKEFDNINLLLELEKRNKGIFIRTMFSFDNVEKLRNGINENGKNYIVSWKDAIKKNNLNNTYYDVTDDSKDIAILFNSYGLNQNVFDEAKKIRKLFNQKNTIKSLINKDLKEENNNNSFTYEWLDKSKPENYILGIFCNCCANITSNCYGNNIAKYSILSNNLQNLVVRDENNVIIGKATIFVNKKKGYAVINDFEINKKYRYGESEKNPGIYLYETNYIKTKKEREQTKLRLLIFKTFIRGINDFVKEYNNENDIKIRKVNVGMGANRLKANVLEYMPEMDENKLYVPKKYSFEDATKKHQYMLYVG